MAEEKKERKGLKVLLKAVVHGVPARTNRALRRRRHGGSSRKRRAG